MGVNILLDFQFDPAWQDGTLAQRGDVVVFPSLPRVLAVLGLRDDLCRAALVIAPARCREWFVVRWGIYTGVVLAISAMVMVAATGASKRLPSYVALFEALAGEAVQVVIGVGVACGVVWAARRWARCASWPLRWA